MTKIKWDDYIKTVCSLTGLEEDEINSETHIYNEIGIDSLGVMSLGLKLQDKFSKRMPLSAASVINTIGDMFEILNESEDE